MRPAPGVPLKRATRPDEKTDAALLARAKREGKSISEVMREVLRKELIA